MRYSLLEVKVQSYPTLADGFKISRTAYHHNNVHFKLSYVFLTDFKCDCGYVKVEHFKKSITF